VGVDTLATRVVPTRGRASGARDWWRRDPDGGYGPNDPDPDDAGRYISEIGAA
jgi:hypothetical protein